MRSKTFTQPLPQQKGFFFSLNQGKLIQAGLIALLKFEHAKTRTYWCI